MKSKVFLIIGSLLICISFIFLLKDIIIEYNAGKKSMEVLNIINEKTNTMENISNDNEMQTIKIDGYDYIGTISIPSLNLNLPVLDTWDYDRLNIGPCLYYGSIYTNNLIICGHSYKKHFKYLGNLSQNDIVIFTDVFDNSYVYEVVEVEILSSTNVDEMINNDFDLTLYTCTSDSLNRITVRCNLKKEVFGF